MTAGRLTRLVAVAVLAAAPLVLSPPAQADAPAATGWWNATTREGLPTPPPPPDVKDGDLLVQAGDPSGTVTGAGTSAPSAVAAVRFTIPEGATVGALSFAVADGATAQDVRAYAAPDPWKPVLNGRLADAPTPDRARFSGGVLEDGRLVFPDIARLLSETGPLSVVILPGTADRLVLRKPGPDALAVTPAPPTSGRGTFAPALPPTGDAPPPPESASAPALEPRGAPVFAPLEAPALDGPEIAPAPPEAASAAANAPLSLAEAAPTAGLGLLPDDTRTRYYAAAEALLVLITFGLLGWGPFGRLAAVVPSKTAAVGPDPVGPMRGVGRFSQPRQGIPRRL